MKDFLVLQSCDHIILQTSDLVSDRELHGEFPLTSRNILVRYGIYKIEKSDYVLRQEPSSNTSVYFRVIFNKRRRLSNPEWDFTIRYTTNIDFCPKCTSSGVVNELRTLPNGNYRELEYPNNYIQHLFFVIFQKKGEHPFYSFLGTYLQNYVLNKELGNLESEIRDATEEYNRLRSVYASLANESFIYVNIVNIEYIPVTEQHLKIKIFTNLQPQPLTVGVNL